MRRNRLSPFVASNGRICSMNRHDGTVAPLDHTEACKTAWRNGRLAFPTYTQSPNGGSIGTPGTQRPAYSSPVARSAVACATMGRARWLVAIGSVARASEKRGDDHAMTPIFSDAIIPTEQTSSAVWGPQMRAGCRSGGQ
jgi:hypothetical protein